MTFKDDIDKHSIFLNQWNLIDSSSKIGRICLHDSVMDKIQVMVIRLGAGETYPSHFHKETPEFYWILNGSLCINIRQDDLARQVILSPDHRPGFFMKVNTVHSLFNCSDSEPCFYLEVRSGPFLAGDNFFV
jgi:cupin fold WbuC family metalloprotein